MTKIIAFALTFIITFGMFSTAQAMGTNAADPKIFAAVAGAIVAVIVR